VSGICYRKYVYFHKYAYLNTHYCTNLVFKNSSSVYNDLLNKSDFTLFLKQLKLSSIFISLGKYLYNLIPIFITLFRNKDVLQNAVCRSYLLLVLCSSITKFCFKLPLCFFMKHKTSKIYSEVTVRILFSLNFCLQDSRFFKPVINLTTYF